MNKKIIIIIVLILIIFGGAFIFIKNSKYKTNDTESTDIEIPDDIDWDSLAKYDLELSGDSVTIDKEGVYTVTGTIDNGSLIINTTGYVKLILDNVTINSEDEPAIYIQDSKRTYIYLKEGTTSKLSDGNLYKDENLDGTIYSKSDLWFGGTGTIEITSNYKDAIVSKDDLIIENGIFNIISTDDGIRGKDRIIIKDGTFNIESQGDGIKSTNDKDTSLGYILIEKGNYNITSKLDALSAVTNIQIEEGTFTIKTGDSSTKIDSGTYENSTTTESMKGIKAGNNIIINGGTFNIDSSDDSIHSNNNIIINNGTIDISSCDDGIHADNELTINNGNINIIKSYEGIEGANIKIEDGNIKIVASDDGVNVGGGNDGSSLNRPGANTYNENANRLLTINGGYLYVDSKGDGLDSNGSIIMTGGTVIVNGPTDNGNGALDYDGTFKLTGGTLIAAGSSGMVQNISDSSTQNSVLINFNSTYTAGTLVNITSSDGDVITFKPSKNFSSIVISTPLFNSNETYTVNIGGNYNGEEKDGLYSNGTYSNGTKYDAFTFSSTTAIVGEAGMMGGAPNGMQNGDQRANRDYNQGGQREQVYNGN